MTQRDDTLRPRMLRAARDIGGVVLGKERAIRLALTCLIARGHLLIEDLPGVGKTTLAHALARVLGLDYRRIQFTSDLLPADVLGVSVYEEGGFRFHPGPIFTQIVLADEINRASPKTQSALLESMEESQVSVEGETRPLPEPFFVIATQNPLHLVGTYPLPESQLDRFLMRIELGYPGPQAERKLLAGGDRGEALRALRTGLDAAAVQAAQRTAGDTHVAPALLDYVQALIGLTRSEPRYQPGLSPRAGMGLIAAARAWAWLEGRGEVLPEDIQAVLPAVAGHRLGTAEAEGTRLGNAAAQELIAAVAIP